MTDCSDLYILMTKAQVINGTHFILKPKAMHIMTQMSLTLGEMGSISEYRDGNKKAF